MSIFRAYDIRGIYPKEINEETALKIGKAFGTFNPGKIIVGDELRLSGPSLKKELIKGLLSTGATVIDIGTVTSPIVMFATRYLKCNGGINVTASHNPKEYNGFKFYYKNGMPIDFETGLIKIQDIFENEKFAEGKGKLIKKDIIKDYSDFILRMIKIKKPMKIVVDAGNGSTGKIYPNILKKVGLNVYELFCEPDGNFPNHEPNPSKTENLGHLQEKVLELGADLGFAYDGDGDRLAVVDKNGSIAYVGVVFSILIKNALEKEPGSKVIYTVLDSKAIDDIIREQGGIPVVCRVGHTYITQKMIEEKAVIAGEISGHYYFKETYGADDALFASLKLIETLVNSNQLISDFSDRFPKYFSQVSEGLRVPIKETEKFNFIEKLKNDFRNRDFNIDTTDGVKVFFEDGWALFRPSNTEPIISISYEAEDETSFERIKKFVDDIITRIPR